MEDILHSMACTKTKRSMVITMEEVVIDDGQLPSTLMIGRRGGAVCAYFNSAGVGLKLFLRQGHNGFSGLACLSPDELRILMQDLQDLQMLLNYSSPGVIREKLFCLSYGMILALLK
jgi:hypothetical protein